MEHRREVRDFGLFTVEEMLMRPLSVGARIFTGDFFGNRPAFMEQS